MQKDTQQVKTLLVLSGPTSTPIEGGRGGATIRRTVVQLQDGLGYVLLYEDQGDPVPKVSDETAIYKCDVEGNIQSYSPIWWMQKIRTEEVLSQLETGLTVLW